MASASETVAGRPDSGERVVEVVSRSDSPLIVDPEDERVDPDPESPATGSEDAVEDPEAVDAVEDPEAVDAVEDPEAVDAVEDPEPVENPGVLPGEGLPDNGEGDPASDSLLSGEALPPRWWSFMGGLEPELPLDDPVADDPAMAGDLFAGMPDLFDDLEPAFEPMGLGGSNRQVEDFDAGILRTELLSRGVASPLERQGFRFGLGLQTIYDSNIYTDAMNEVSDLSLVVSPSVEYRSAPAGVPGLVTLRYTPFLRMYLDETDLNTVDHSASANVSFTGARGSFDVGANYGRFSHADRFSTGQRESETLSVRASAAYQIASRTSLEASVSASTSSDTSLGQPGVAPLGSTDQDSLQLQLAGYWQATSKTRFGPSVRYSKDESTTIGNREALAFLIVADYVPRDQLSISAGLGVERLEDDLRGNSTDLTGNIGVNYRPNDRWTLGADLNYQAIPARSRQLSQSGGGAQGFTGGLSVAYTPNPDWSFAFDVSADAFPSVDSANYSIGDQTYSASVTRQLPQGSISLSGSLGFSEYDALGGVAVNREDEEFYSVALRYRRPIMAERGSFHSSLQWSENTGNQDWSRLQFTTGVDLTF